MLTDVDTLLAHSVPTLLRQRASETPNSLALSARSAGGWRDRLSYAQLVNRMAAGARGLAALGLGPGDGIAVFLTNDAGRECFLTALAVLELGAILVPLNTRYADAELDHALSLIEPAAIVTSAASVRRLSRLHPGMRILVIDPGTSAAREVWPDPLTVPPGANVAPITDPDTLGCLIFTAGTTGRAKAVMHTHRTMIGAGLCCSRALGLGPGDLYQGGWPFFTSSALNLGGLSSWVAGAGLVFEELLDSPGRLRLIAEEQTTFYHGAPSVVQFMLSEMATAPYDVSCLRRVGYGGAAMPAETIRRIETQWPGLEQVQIYGVTESGPTGVVLPPDRVWDKLGTIGTAMPLCTVSVLDATGEPVPAGEEGEIAIEGPGVAMGYFRNAAASRAAFTGARVRTGDLGRMDADGYLTFTDRKRDVITRGGLKIASVAVESVLHQYPGVREAAVIGVPHPKLGEDVAACLSAEPGVALDPAALAAFCRDKLPAYEIPQRWMVLPDLPKSPLGKVLKTDLRSLF